MGKLPIESIGRKIIGIPKLDSTEGKSAQQILTLRNQRKNTAEKLYVGEIALLIPAIVLSIILPYALKISTFQPEGILLFVGAVRFAIESQVNFNQFYSISRNRRISRSTGADR